MENKNVFHERLTELMIEKVVNTVSLAAAIGVSDETVRRWKNGERDILLSQLVKLADYFQCSLDFFNSLPDIIFVYANDSLLLCFSNTVSNDFTTYCSSFLIFK